MERQIVYNGLKTPDGTIINSVHRHDYVTHEDKNGKHYMIDGGLDYVRRSVNGDEETITIYADDEFETVRQYFRWGRNYDKDKNLLPKTEWVILKDITDYHLDALCIYEKVPKWVTKLFLIEKQFRNILNELY